MSITLDGTNGITTPDVTSTGLTADTTTLVVDDVNDRVGIGTSSPVNKLDVAGDINISVGNAYASNIYYSSGWKYKTNGYAGFIKVPDSNGNIIFSQFANNSSGAGAAGTEVERMRIDSSGNLLVGTTSTGGTAGALLHAARGGTVWNYGPATVGSGNNFYVLNGSGTGVYLVSGQTSWTANSDERLKTAITPFENASQKVCSLRSGTGRYLTDDESVSRSFLIAQDVQAVLPEAVHVQDDEQGTLGLQYTDVIPLLVAAIKEQQAIIEEQKTALEAQQQAIAGLTARVEALEANNV